MHQFLFSNKLSVESSLKYKMLISTFFTEQYLAKCQQCKMQLKKIKELIRIQFKWSHAKPFLILQHESQ